MTDKQSVQMAGYLIVPSEKVPETYNAGFSLYSAAWPLVDEYPGNQFQTGLFGTWMFAQYDGPRPKELYSDIEGGLGWWRDTRFATTTPKFIMGGVALKFCEWANGPGAGKGRSWEEPKGKYGVAQLSPRVLWPPDGLNLKQGTCGELFGYGYLPLPLTRPKSTTAGAPVPTGNNCWTLFLNTGNFKGPVAFFTPSFWSRVTAEQQELAGMFLDSRPAEPNKSLQMETQYIPAKHATAANGELYARVAPVSFPSDAQGESPVLHQVTAYKRSALWEAVEAWFAGGPVAAGAVDPEAAIVHTFREGGRATWSIYQPPLPREGRPHVDWGRFATPTPLAPHTFGYRWDDEWVTRSPTESRRVVLPEYFRQIQDEDGETIWIPVHEAEVPEETGLTTAHLERPAEESEGAYVTPDDPDSCWKKPGPVAGPFEAHPGDGSVVTYYWYRFADQPALLNADLTDEEREELQTRAELIHRHWQADRDYLPPPALGQLAEIDPALLVTPPSGLEVGYVPIATRQGRE